MNVSIGESIVHGAVTLSKLMRDNEKYITLTTYSETNNGPYVFAPMPELSGKTHKREALLYCNYNFSR